MKEKMRPLGQLHRLTFILKKRKLSNEKSWVHWTLSRKLTIWVAEVGQASILPKPLLWHPSPTITALPMTLFHHSSWIFFRIPIWPNFMYTSVWGDIARAFYEVSVGILPPQHPSSGRTDSWEDYPQRPQYW